MKTWMKLGNVYAPLSCELLTSTLRAMSNAAMNSPVGKNQVS